MNVAYAASKLNEIGSAERVTREELVGIAEAALAAADEMYMQGDPEAGDMALEVAYAATDAALGFVPGVGWAKDVCEAVTGTSLVTGETLDDTDRMLAVVGVLTGGVGSKIKNVRKIGNVLRRLGTPARIRNAEKFVEATAAAERVVESAKDFTSKLTPGKIRDYLKDVENIPRETLVKDMESIGLSVKGRSPDGRFMEFVDKNERVRAKIHPPDDKTPTSHLHIYDREGNSLNKALDVVTRKSPEGHIPISE